jgi:hypothetical protein
MTGQGISDEDEDESDIDDDLENSKSILCVLLPLFRSTKY